MHSEILRKRSDNAGSLTSFLPFFFSSLFLQTLSQHAEKTEKKNAADNKNTENRTREEIRKSIQNNLIPFCFFSTLEKLRTKNKEKKSLVLLNRDYRLNILLPFSLNKSMLILFVYDEMENYKIA